MKKSGHENWIISPVWEEMLKTAFGSIDLVGTHQSLVSASIRQIPIANLTLIETTSNLKIAKRTSRNISTDDDEYFILIMVKEGKLKITQFNRECELTPNTFGLFHLGSPSFYCHREKTKVVDLKIPASTLRSYVRDPYRYVGIARSANRGIGRVTADIFRSLIDEAPHMPEWALHACAGQLMGVVTTAIECSDEQDLPLGNSASSAAIFKRAEAFIEINAGNTSLDSSTVAQAAGVSLRYLQRIFQDRGLSVGEFIRNCRLKRCHDSLLNAGGARDLIKEIAFKGGFKNPAHFSTAFKRRYGMSPEDLRKINFPAHQTE